jgi:hypothetical protein
MENFILDNDIKAFCITAKSFPDGVLEAHQALHALVPFTTDRKYFGVSRLEKGVIVYKSVAEEKSPGEGDKLGCEPFSIQAGKYIYITIKDFRKDISTIWEAFEQLLSHPNMDPEGYCLEWYLGQNDVRCMIRLKS